MTPRLTLTAACALACACGTTRAPLPPPTTPLVATPASAVPPLPEARPGPGFRAPRVHAWTLDNGMHVYVLPRAAWPTAYVSLVSRHAGEDGPLSEAGLPSLLATTMALSDKPARTLSAIGTASAAAGEQREGAAQPEEADSEGASPAQRRRIFLSNYQLRHSAAFQAEVESDRLATTVAVLAKKVRTPELTEERVERAKAYVKGRWYTERYTLQGAAINFIKQRLYGPNHILGQHAKKGMERIQEHALEALRAAYPARFSPEACALIVVGDVHPEQVRALADTHFGAWRPSGLKPTRYKRPTWRPGGKRFVFLHAGDTELARIAIGQKLPGRLSGDYVALRVLAELLGGVGRLDSRLNRALREEAGVTYGAVAFYTSRIDGGTLLLTTAVQRDAAEAATRRMLQEMQRLRDELVPARELENAKLQVLEALRLRLETNEQAADTLTELFQVGLLPARLPEYARQVRALTAEQLREVARRVLTPHKAPVVVVGDLDTSYALGQWAEEEDETY